MARSAAGGERVVQDGRAQVLLQVAEAVHGNYLRDIDTLGGKVTVDGKEGSVLVGIGPFHADERPPVGPRQAVVPPVRGRPRERHHRHGCRPGISFKQ